MRLQDDEKHVEVLKDKILKACAAKGWTRTDFSEKTGIDIRTVRNIYTRGLMMPRHVPKVAKALEMDANDFLKSSDSTSAPEYSMNEYSWKNFEVAADDVAFKAFREFKADAVLTFPGTSLIFTGLVLSRISFSNAVRANVQIALMKPGKAPSLPVGYEAVAADSYTIFVPTSLTSDTTRKIVVIDDYITSGGAMESLRKLFLKKRFPAENVKFACCICYEGLAVRPDPNAKMPDFIGVKKLAKEVSFTLPWGRKSETFEEALKQKTQTHIPDANLKPASKEKA